MKTNVAFKCNYNDGRQKNHFGYAGACSDDIIEYNIKKSKFVWCSNKDCSCYKHFYNGEELEEYPCYESRLLVDWQGYAGVTHYGEKSEEPRAIRNAESGKIAFLTTVMPYEQEADRLIFGVYRMLNPIEYDNETGGYLPSDVNYRIALNQDERLYFWHYYFNEKSPSTIKWGSILYRYMSDNATILILQDLIKLKSGKKD